MSRLSIWKRSAEIPGVREMLARILSPTGFSPNPIIDLPINTDIGNLEISPRNTELRVFQEYVWTLVLAWHCMNLRHQVNLGRHIPFEDGNPYYTDAIDAVIDVVAD